VYDDISRLVLLAYPGERSVHRDDFGVEAFIEALNDYQLKLYVRSQNPKDLKAALKHASITLDRGGVHKLLYMLDYRSTVKDVYCFYTLYAGVY